MNWRMLLQVAEAMGPDNRWLCSECQRKNVEDQEALFRHYVKNGGAKDFADRFNEAIGDMNKWYCSEFYGRDIQDKVILWDYYMKYRKPIEGRA